jgi:hypothetical protein
MGVDYYVTRNSGPLIQGGHEISEAEWHAAVAADPDLRLAQPEPASGLRYKGLWAVWDSYPGGYPASFALIKGGIEVKGIDEDLYRKLKLFASSLGARIFCETGEELK